MKKNITLLIALLITTNYAIAQAPTLQWQKALGGTQEDKASAIIQTTDGGFITAGYIFSNDGNITTNYGGEDFWVVKTNSSGAVSWQKSYGGTGSDIATGIAQTFDGGYIVSGYSDSADGDVTGAHGEYDFWVVKINSTGTIVWQKTYGGSSNDLAYSGITPTSDGGYIMAGITRSYDGDITENQGNGDGWLVKINGTGVIQWQKSYGGTDDDRVATIKQTVDGGYIFVGKTYSNDLGISGNHGESDYWVAKINAVGTVEWQKCFGGTFEDEATGVMETSDSGYLVNGIIYTTTTNNGNITGARGEYDVWVIRLNATGALQWQRALGGSGADRGFDVVQASDGGCIVLGCPQSNNGDLTLASDSSGSFWLVKLNSLGVLQWQKEYGGTDYDEPNRLTKTSDGGFAIAGYTYSNDGDVSGNHGDTDYWILKLSAETLGIADFNTNDIIIYPNPVRDILQIQKINDSITSIVIIDLTGRVVKKQSKNCETVFVGDLANGTYVLELYSNENKCVGKFIKQ